MKPLIDLLYHLCCWLDSACRLVQLGLLGPAGLWNHKLLWLAAAEFNSPVSSTTLKNLDFFAVLLLPVLVGFERLLSLGTVPLFLSSAAVIESQWHQIFPWKKFGNTGIQTRAAGAQSLNATAVLWRPPRSNDRLILSKIGIPLKLALSLTKR